MELQLLENPRRGRRRYNPAGFDAYFNPISVESYNPTRRKRRMARTKVMPRQVTKWLQGVDIVDTGAAVGGLAVATMLPAAMAQATTGQKLLKLGASLVSAMGAGFVGQQISPSAGKAAVLGGAAGTAMLGLALFTSIQIGGGRRLIGKSGGIGAATAVSPPTTHLEETVSVIEP